MKPTVIVAAFAVAGVLLVAGVMAALWQPNHDDNEKDTKINLPGTETVQMGTAKVISGKLQDQDGRALGGELVSIDATLPDGSTGASTSVTTDSSGAFNFAVTPTMSGQYRVTVTFGGNEECKPSSYVVIVVVVVPDDLEAKATTLTMSGPNTVGIGGVATVSGALKTSGGEAISWAPIAVGITGPDGVEKRSKTATGADGKFSLSIDAKSAGDYIIEASFDGDAVYRASSGAFSFSAADQPVPPTVPSTEPRLNIAYLSGTWGNTVRYGMPEVRSGPYPGWDYQYPGANEFKIESNGYGPDQPDGPVEIATFIKIGGIGPRWVGSAEIPEGTVEVRTFPENAMTPRLVNLFATADGGCQGILVNDWSVFDHTWVYEQGVRDNHKLTFSLDITKLGDYKVTVWEVHDHGDGNAVKVSNEISWTVHVDGSNICYASFDPPGKQYVNGTAYSVTATVQRNTEPDDDNVNLRNTIAYTGTVHNYLTVTRTSGYTIKINGVTQAGTIVDGKLRFDLGTFDFGDMASKAYTFTITMNDGLSHEVRMESYDVGTGQQVGYGSTYYYQNYW